MAIMPQADTDTTMESSVSWSAPSSQRDAISETSTTSSSSEMTTRPHIGSSPDARSKTITTADGMETFGILNRHAAKNPSYQVGLAENKGTRRTMEDSHSFVVDFGGIRGQGFFAVFDGHAGKHAAEWCGAHFHEYLLESLGKSPATTAIPDVLNQTFHDVDGYLSKVCQESDGKIHSGCTAVTAFLRLEDADGKQSFLTEVPERTESPTSAMDTDEPSPPASSSESSFPVSGSKDEGVATIKKKEKKPSNGSRLKNALKNLTGSSSGRTTPTTSRSLSPTHAEGDQPLAGKISLPPASARRVLYCANAGDARGVLSRAGKAVRLTYDHKGSDKQEVKRITDAGGFVVGGRVNGVLAVTRSLGDSTMKEFVVGSPYTTETVLSDEDEFLILACDGLWDVATDQAAVDLIRDETDAQRASEKLLKHAMENHTSDNVTVLVIKLKNITGST